MTLTPIIIIPARLQSTRLPRKPLAEIHGKPMIIHCLERALEADIGPVLVAAAEQEVVDVVNDAGGRAVLTDPSLPSGSDRVYAALSKFDPKGNYQIAINLQGDLPALPPEYLKILLDSLIDDPKADISTLGTPTTYHEAQNPNLVKAIAGIDQIGQSAYALAFSRAMVPWIDDLDKKAVQEKSNFLHHIGLYGWRRTALKAFVTLPPSYLEVRERLEQMRALEAGMRIRITLVDSCPAGVDTFAELEVAREMLKPKK